MALLFHPASNLAARIERDFERAVVSKANEVGRAAEREQVWQPAVDIVERDNAFHVYADLPGVDPKRVDIELENNTLSLKGERVTRTSDEPDASEAKGWLERVSGQFVRRFNLPDTVDPELITARSEFGVLEVIIPKRADLGPRKIEVQQ